MKSTTAAKLKFWAQILFWLSFAALSVLIIFLCYPFAKTQPALGILSILGLIVLAYAACEFLRLLIIAFAELLEDMHEIRISVKK